MRPKTFDVIELDVGAAPLPITLRQSTQARKIAPRVAGMTALAALIVLPQIALALTALASPAVRSALAEHPFIAVELAIVMTFWVAIVCWPLRQLLARAGLKRTVTIDRQAVEVVDTTPFGTTKNTTPLASYRGLAYHLRSSLSGVRHELLLLHGDPSKSLVLLSKDKASEIDLAHWAQRLGLPMIDAAELYRLSRAGRPAARTEAGLAGAIAAPA